MKLVSEVGVGVIAAGVAKVGREYLFLNKQGPLDKQQRREAGSFVDQDQQYFLIKRKTKCKADRTAQRVILMPNISVSHY